MGLHDRPYWKEPPPYQDGGGPAGGGIAFGLPKPGKMVKWLLIINVAMFVTQILFELVIKRDLSSYLGATAGGWWQLWRYVTFQFLHDTGSIWHIALNMLGLYILGTPLEDLWGRRRFLIFYLSCGAVAGIAYVITALALKLPPAIPIIGASGGVYGIILACAILFPHFRIIFLFFPVPIRLASLIIFGGMVLVILGSISSGEVTSQFWSDVAHLGGAAAAAVWVWGVPKFRGSGASVAAGTNEGAWRRKMQQRADRQAEIDRILDKIHDEGIASLTKKEKKLLQDATKQQQKEERKFGRL